MSSNFKKQAAQVRTAIPQIDPESTKPPAITPINSVSLLKPQAQPPINPVQPSPDPTITEQPEAATRSRITQVDTSEAPTNRGFSMYPSRHRQIAKDLTYIEDRKPWQIIEDALEEYVLKHYGKDYKRK